MRHIESHIGGNVGLLDIGSSRYRFFGYNILLLKMCSKI
jgi:hypothetical protein